MANLLAPRAPVTTQPAVQRPITVQGISVPNAALDPAGFFKETRRHTQLEKQINTNATGTDIISFRKADILSSFVVRIAGNVVVTGGTTNVSRRWPYDLLHVKFQANGQSNLINANGLKLKAREQAKKTDITDRGVSQSIGGSTVTQGTMSMAHESWGVGSGATAVGAGTYGFEIDVEVPVAESDIDLVGAVFLASSTADLTAQFDYLPINQLFYGGTATSVAFSNVTTTVVSKKFSIPVVGNNIVVPDLSVFHSFIESRDTNIANGSNEYRFVGQGGAKSLLRVLWQGWNGNGTGAVPLAVNSTNYGPLSWGYGTSEFPDVFPDGDSMRMTLERMYDSDLGNPWGIGTFDFADEFEFRDVVDMSTTSDLRMNLSIQQGVTLNAGAAIEYCLETVYGQAA